MGSTTGRPAPGAPSEMRGRQQSVRAWVHPRSCSRARSVGADGSMEFHERPHKKPSVAGVLAIPISYALEWSVGTP